MKRANGTGTIVKLKGNRRKPWFAKATVGYKENGQPIQKAVCNEKGEKYFESRPEAEETLIWWNKNHGNLNVNKLTYKGRTKENEKNTRNYKRKTWTIKFHGIISSSKKIQILI